MGNTLDTELLELYKCFKMVCLSFNHAEKNKIGVRST